MKIKSSVDGWSETELTLEDWFAGMALQGLLSQRQEAVDTDGDGDSGIVYPGSYISKQNHDHTEAAARDAYEFAESMLFVRKRIEFSRSYLEVRNNEYERIAKALGDSDPECSGFGYLADLIEANADKIKKIIHGGRND